MKLLYEIAKKVPINDKSLPIITFLILNKQKVVINDNNDVNNDNNINHISKIVSIHPKYNALKLIWKLAIQKLKSKSSSSSNFNSLNFDIIPSDILIIYEKSTLIERFDMILKELYSSLGMQEIQLTLKLLAQFATQ